MTRMSTVWRQGYDKAISQTISLISFRIYRFLFPLPQSIPYPMIYALSDSDKVRLVASGASGEADMVKCQNHKKQKHEKPTKSVP